MPKRFMWSAADFNIIQDIVLNGDGGRFKRIICDRATGKNLEKLEAWTEVTRLFNEVPVPI
jgi:hypothetical protein